MTEEQLAIKNVGKQDPKRHLGETVNTMLVDNITQSFASAIDAISFK
jgi:26S proteasome regulatory subunit N11